MDLAEIGSSLNRVEERHVEAECMLVEVRNNIGTVGCERRGCAAGVGAEGMLDDCEGLLEEISSDIDYIKGELREVADAFSPAKVQFGDEMTPMLIQLLRVGWKQEQLEDAHEALSRACQY